MGRITGRFLGRVLVLLAWSPLAFGEMSTGECVVFREGGDGRLLKTPTYWLKGRVLSVATERRALGVCPKIAKPPSRYTHEDWVRLAQSMPCHNGEAGPQELEVSRVSVVVDSWETPWSALHGTAGLLFRGNFMGHPLTKDSVVDIDATWLERCESTR